MPAPVVLPQVYRGIVTHKTKLSPTVILVRLRFDRPIPYQPGQYASWLIGPHRRPLSFATPANDRLTEFLVDISPGGVASQYTAELSVGDTVRCLAPYGRFIVDDTDSRPLLFLAGGTGVAPIRGQILHELARPERRAMTLIFGNRTEADTFWLDEFELLAQNYEHFTFIAACSEPSSAWRGATGHVSDVAIETIHSLEEFSIYVCGGRVMVRETKAALLAQGVPINQIFTEQFI